MGVIDVDPDVLRLRAEAALHAADQSWVHMRAEMAGKIPELMRTLTPRGPYGYTIMPEVHPDGRVRLPVIGTYEDIEAAYHMVRGASDLLSIDPFVEIRGTWYTFCESLNGGRVRANGQEGIGETVAIFPSSRGTGITGELVWKKVPRDILGSAPAPEDGWPEERSFRLHLLKLHDRYIAALRAGDVEAVLDTYNDGVQGAVRDYVEDSGALASLDGKAEHRTYYEALFAKFEVVSVDMIERVIQDWYVFSELRLSVRARTGGGSVAFHIAEFYIPAKDGRFIARIGHGTDPA